ncbi:MAG: reverse transcriptase domain-containing protein [Nocardioides sp.]
MWGGLEAAVATAATRGISDYEAYLRWVYEENVRRARRSTATIVKVDARQPSVWSLDPGFNPFHVRARSNVIAHSMTRKLKSGTYLPQWPAGRRVAKPSGGTRLVSMFPIADEVVSNRLYSSLMDKNRPRLSSRSYAYRRDLSPHDAIQYMKSEFGKYQRLFIAEYDFSKFFDKITHEHVWASLDSQGIVRTALENTLVDAFLRAPYPYLDAAGKKSSPAVRSVGVPQGTSISLFLANVAAAPLDRALERLGVGFVRYADDTVIWSSSYNAVCEAATVLHELSEAIGSPINFEKSPGVRILRAEQEAAAEIVSTTRVEYLGHDVGLRTVRMRQSAIERIRARVDRLIYTNLLLEPIKGTQELSRVGTNDRDYVVYIWQLRRYLYGPLSEAEIRRFQHGEIPPLTFKGVMSYFPLVDDDQTLAELDEWITTRTWLALRRRSLILTPVISAPSPPAPWTASRTDLHKLKVVSATTGSTVDLRLPSIRRISTLIKSAIQVHGVGTVTGRTTPYHY